MLALDAVFRIEGVYLLILALLVIAVGEFIARRVRVIHDYSVPAVVVGGLLCAVAIAAMKIFGDVRIELGSDFLQIMLLIFFSTVGLSVKLRDFGADLKALFVLLVLAIALLIFQDMVGSAIAAAIGVHPAYGLLAGSVTFIGGHGTGIAWGEIFADRFDLKDAQQTALACATFGLVLGGLVGGPLARRLISKNDLSGDTVADAYTPSVDDPNRRGPASLYAMLSAILQVAICVGVSHAAAPLLRSIGLTVPEFVIALLAGSILTNLMDRLPVEQNINAIGLISDVSLQIFLAIAVSSVQLLSLQNAIGPLLLVFLFQVIIVVVFAYFIVFPTMGRDYDAGVMCAGFIGFGLGATPVGLANMRAITRKFGASPKAFLVVPLVGAFLIDIVNSFVIQLYLSSPVLD